MTLNLKPLSQSFWISILCHALVVVGILTYGLLPKHKELIVKPAQNVIAVSFYSQPQQKPVIAKAQKQSKAQQTKQTQHPTPAIKQSVKSITQPTPKIINPQKTKLIQKTVAIKSRASDAYSLPQKATQEKSLVNKNHSAQLTSTESPEKMKTDTNSNPPQQVQAAPFDKNNYIASVKRKIASHKFYPMPAKRRGIEGRVGLNLSISESGHIHAIHITQSSGSDTLDSAAIECVRKAAPFNPPSNKISFNFGISYSLNEG